MNPVITLEMLQEEYEVQLAHCVSKVPVCNWKIQPQNRVHLTNRKKVYGLAYQCGRVEINEIFIGSDAVDKLRATLRHEFAHFTVGLEEHHNKKFKAVAELYGSYDYSDHEVEKLNSQILYKWQLVAHVNTGELVEIGKFHRRNKKYLDYPGAGLLLEHNSKMKPIVRFEYLSLN